jgi:L,D-peptidoglycan transpeptidase YkuD (ErfK/YbiS/YcfS/YnhG family)
MDIKIYQNPRYKHQGLLVMGAMRFRCVLGKKGISFAKTEGDQKTPHAVMQFIKIYYRADRVPRPRTHLPVSQIKPCDGWCDAPQNRNYNRRIRLPYPASHEQMWRTDSVYDYVVDLNWNRFPRRKNKGSAIFFHLSRGEEQGTAGCIAITNPQMQRVLAACGRTTKLKVMRNGC